MSALNHTILFVCTGNTCRSPAAARILQACLEKRGENCSEWLIDSAGLHAGRGQPVSRQMAAALARRGLDPSRHRSRPLEDVNLDQYAVILVMEAAQRQDLLARFPVLNGKVLLLAEVCSRHDDVVDPYGAGETVYDRTVQQIETLLECGYEQIRKLAELNLEC